MHMIQRPRDFLEFTLQHLMDEVTGTTGRVDGNFFDAGGTSLGSMMLLKRIEAELGVRLTAHDLFRAPSAQALAEVVRTGDSSDWQKNLVRVNTAQGPLHTYIVHGMGGEAFAFEPLRSASFSSGGVTAIRAVGCDGGEPWLNTFEEMADRYADLIEEDRPEGPIVLGGYCLGSLIALETADRLRDRGRDVPLLFAFDAPLHPPAYTPEERELLLSGRHPDLDELAKTGIADDSFDLSVDSWEKVTEVLIGLGRLAPGATPDVMERRLRLLGTNLLAWADYVPRPVDVDVVVMFGPDFDEPTRRAALATWEEVGRTATLDLLDAPHSGFFASPSVAESMERHTAAVAGVTRV